MSTRPPIEGDGVRVNFYSLLLRTPGEVAPPLRVSIPDTIVFEHNCPRSWFYYDSENREIRKRAGRDLQAGTILAEFGAPSVGMASGAAVPTTISTVATFTYLRHEDAASTPAVTTLYLTREGLERLLITTSVVKLEGILQKHFLPLEQNECVIQSTWGAKLCMVRRRMNGKTLTDRLRLLSEKHCTFDGPDHLSIEVATAKDTVGDITRLTERIVDHVARTSRMRPVSMMLYFKLDQQRKPRLLWCSSLRFEGHPFVHPPSSLFVCPELEGFDTTADDAILDELTAAQGRLEDRSRTTVADMSPARTMNTISVLGMDNRHGGPGVVLPPEAAARIERLCGQWHGVNDEVDDEVRRVEQQREVAMQLVDDVLYGVHTQFQQQDPSGVVIRFPPELMHLLGGDAHLDDLTRAIGLTSLANGDMVIPSPGVQRSAPPTSVMMAMARDWLDRHFASRLTACMDRASTYVQWAALEAALPMM